MVIMTTMHVTALESVGKEAKLVLQPKIGLCWLRGDRKFAGALC